MEPRIAAERIKQRMGADGGLIHAPPVPAEDPLHTAASPRRMARDPAARGRSSIDSVAPPHCFVVSGFFLTTVQPTVLLPFRFNMFDVCDHNPLVPLARAGETREVKWPTLRTS